MRHHFGDFLDRDGGYWTIIPNRERYAYRIGSIPEGSPEITIVTVGKNDKEWERVLTLPNLEELTLHEPSPEQLQAISALSSLKRLRITHAKPKTIDFIAPMESVEELVLEYVSGFSDLSPLRNLKRLRALHLENLRRVSDFGGLSGMTSLKYLSIDGTLDWKQPVKDFEFLSGLPGLEVLALVAIICPAPYPAMLPALKLGQLKSLRLHCSRLSTEEYALLEEGLKGVDGAEWGPFYIYSYSWNELPDDDVRTHLPEDVLKANHPDVVIRYDGKRIMSDPASEWVEFTGKAAGRVMRGSSTEAARCRAQAERYELLKQQARELIDRCRDS